MSVCIGLRTPPASRICPRFERKSDTRSPHMATPTMMWEKERSRVLRILAIPSYFVVVGASFHDPPGTILTGSKCCASRRLRHSHRGPVASLCADTNARNAWREPRDNPMSGLSCADRLRRSWHRTEKPCQVGTRKCGPSAPAFSPENRSQRHREASCRLSAPRRLYAAPGGPFAT